MVRISDFHSDHVGSIPTNLKFYEINNSQSMNYNVYK